MKKFSILFLIVFVWACDPCRDVNCVNGTCTDGTCECIAGWTGELCDVDMCASVNCVNGTCVAGVCQCNSGWTGTLCDECLKDCDHGECNASGDCDCDNGWTGDLCDEEEVTTICTNTCQYHNDGECDDGGPGSDWDLCLCGTDCADCGTRTEAECAGGGGDGNGAIAVWTALTSFPCNTQQIDIYIDGDYEGYIDSYCSSQPDCGDGCTVTVEVTAGTHEVYAECNNGDAYWGPGNVTVGTDVCYLLELTEKKSFSPFQTKYRR